MLRMQASYRLLACLDDHLLNPSRYRRISLPVMLQ